MYVIGNLNSALTFTRPATAGNTNGANFELFAAVADANGFGLPLAFLFIKTTPDAAKGAKQTVLERFLGGLKELGVEPEFTLTDKDWSEIGAMHVTWDDAKQQLCFWHGIRAVKQRLCKNKSTPGPYDAEAAHKIFSFIDVNFVPISQQKPGQEVTWSNYRQRLVLTALLAHRYRLPPRNPFHGFDSLLMDARPS